jgi:arginine-tRNA-protein transferase
MIETDSPREMTPITESLPIIEKMLYAGHLKGECPYLKDRPYSFYFIHGSPVSGMHRDLMDAGYRRHGKYFYRPVCDGCRECRVIRVNTESFRPSRSQKRILKRGRSLFRIDMGEPDFTESRLHLYERYIAARHPSDPTAPGIKGSTYREFFVESCAGKNTKELQFYAGDTLCGVGIVDFASDSLSSVYFFFDPSISRHSPGIYSMLIEIEIAREANLGWYYPGYYIAGCDAMSYKASLRPHQIRNDRGEWIEYVDRSEPSPDPARES